jgi:hypothetical protein
MKGVYTSGGKIAANAAARTLAYLTAPSNKVLEILSVTLTDESNATNYQMQVSIANITTLGSPANFTTPTPAPHEKGDQAAGATLGLGANNSAEPTTYGSTITQEGATALIGYRHEPQPEERIYVAPGASIGIKLNTTPPATDFDVRVTWREIG